MRMTFRQRLLTALKGERPYVMPWFADLTYWYGAQRARGALPAEYEGDEGFVKLHVKKGSDRILGATIVAAHAGEMISEVTLAIVGKLGLGALLGVIHPYPTQAEGIKRAAGAYARSRLGPRLARLLAGWMRLRR